ncbi:hypothetical protein BJV82DRAFT_366785 [Fennellomyces sp. T-0311]|nr:hypothetical protein BJV82DRAFT_366785 [Fennellomyces sp. T-0311]
MHSNQPKPFLKGFTDETHIFYTFSTRVMTQTDPSRFSARQAAILDFEQTQCPDIPRRNRRKATMRSFAAGDYDNSIKEAKQAIDDVYQFELVKFIDIRIRAHVAKGEYPKALEAALEMRKYVPKYYYGYLREAQIYLVQENYAKAFKALTTGIKNVTQRGQVSILKHSINDCLSILDRVASAYGKDQNFNDGQHVAKLMIKLLPTSPAGYLRSGILFLMDGKTVKASKIYEKGIATVPFAYRYSLINCKNHVLQQLNHNNPFFFHFPWSIISLIFQFLDTRDLVKCMEVSVRWREVILQLQEVWQELTIRGEFDIYAIRDAWQFVEKLYIQDSCSCIVSACLKLIMDGSFDNLETLASIRLLI